MKRRTCRTKRMFQVVPLAEACASISAVRDAASIGDIAKKEPYSVMVKVEEQRGVGKVLGRKFDCS